MKLFTAIVFTTFSFTLIANNSVDADKFIAIETACAQLKKQKENAIKSVNVSLSYVYNSNVPRKYWITQKEAGEKFEDIQRAIDQIYVNLIHDLAVKIYRLTSPELRQYYVRQHEATRDNQFKGDDVEPQLRTLGKYFADSEKLLNHTVWNTYRKNFRASHRDIFVKEKGFFNLAMIDQEAPVGKEDQKKLEYFHEKHIQFISVLAGFETARNKQSYFDLQLIWDKIKGRKVNGIETKGLLDAYDAIQPIKNKKIYTRFYEQSGSQILPKYIFLIQYLEAELKAWDKQRKLLNSIKNDREFRSLRRSWYVGYYLKSLELARCESCKKASGEKFYVGSLDVPLPLACQCKDGELLAKEKEKNSKNYLFRTSCEDSFEEKKDTGLWDFKNSYFPNATIPKITEDTDSSMGMLESIDEPETVYISYDDTITHTSTLDEMSCSTYYADTPLENSPSSEIELDRSSYYADTPLENSPSPEIGLDKSSYELELTDIWSVPLY